MPSQLEPLLASAARDPVLAYSLAAALLLAAVSLFGGLSRLDWLALTNPRASLRVLGLVALSFVIAAAAEVFAASGTAAQGTILGLSRFPIYLAALAYGPTVGLLAGVLHAAFASTTPLPGLSELVLMLELTVLGWLAIFPSPRTARLAGPLDALLAYALAWGTGGIALAAASGTTIEVTTVLAQHWAKLAGIALTAALLASIGPGVYRRAFPGSRIDPALARSRTLRGAQLSSGRELPAFVTHRGVLEREERGARALSLPEPVAMRARHERDRGLSPEVLPEDEFTR